MGSREGRRGGRKRGMGVREVGSVVSEGRGEEGREGRRKGGREGGRLWVGRKII